MPASRDLLPATLEHQIAGKIPALWINDHWRPFDPDKTGVRLDPGEIFVAESRLNQFAVLLMRLFPELIRSRGIIESPLLQVAKLQSAMIPAETPGGQWLIKADHALPIAGSIKARGGIYEVLLHAEALALRHGVMQSTDNRVTLALPPAHALFAQHHVAVGSTGNLGLSIGMTAAALGFQATVHMSAEAKAWKKARLRAGGVRVVEHGGDFTAAVAAGREEAKTTPNAYFVDDEDSQHLFLGYSVAAIRLKQQLLARNVRVDAAHPLLVYLPCGVGGAPGGICFGLRAVFGDAVHCFLAEPVAAPSMLVRLAALHDRPIAVSELGLDARTEADGLAVGRASEFVARIIRTLISGAFTVLDEELLADLFVLEQTEGVNSPPAKAGGFGIRLKPVMVGLAADEDYTTLKLSSGGSGF
jgi:D-serine dehydratase